MSTYRRTTWREREVQAERERQEFAARVAEEARAKTMAKTETNFPSTMRTTTAPTSSTMTPGKFAELAMKWQIDESIMYRHARSDRERKVIRDTVMFLRSRGAAERPSREEEEPEETWVMPQESLAERFPAHGKRGTCTAPDGDGWRLVTKKARKQPRALTEAELARRYRDAFFTGDAPDEDVNEDLTDRNQRREFY